MCYFLVVDVYRSWCDVQNLDDLWESRVVREFGGCGLHVPCGTGLWKDTFLDLVSSRSALHRANQSALHEFSSSVSEWYMQVSFVDFRADDDAFISSGSYAIRGNNIVQSRRPHSILVSGSLKSTDQCSQVRKCKLWVKHLGIWKLIDQAPGFEGNNSYFDDWRWVNKTGWSVNKTSVDETGHLQGAVTVYIHYCDVFHSLACWRDSDRIPRFHLQRLGFPEQSRMPLFWLVMNFTPSSDLLQNSDIWVPLGQFGDSIESKGMHPYTVQNMVKMEGGHRVLSVDKICEYETVDFCLFDSLGNFLLGRSCVEVWQRDDSGCLVLEFLEDNLREGNWGSSRILVDSMDEEKHLVSLELTPSCWEICIDLL